MISLIMVNLAVGTSTRRGIWVVPGVGRAVRILLICDSVGTFYNDNITKKEKDAFRGIPRHHPLETHLPPLAGRTPCRNHLQSYWRRRTPQLRQAAEGRQFMI